MRVHCSACDDIIDSDTDYGQMSCKCGTVYFIKEWTTGEVTLRVSRQDVATVLDDDNDGHQYDEYGDINDDSPW